MPVVFADILRQFYFKVLSKKEEHLIILSVLEFPVFDSFENVFVADDQQQIFESGTKVGKVVFSICDSMNLI